MVAFCQVKRLYCLLILTFLSIFLEEGAYVFGEKLPVEGVYRVRVEAFTREDYFRALEQLCRQFEKKANKQLKPGKLGKVGLKVYCNSGVGLCTPKALVLAMIDLLEKRGFKKENILIIDLSTPFLKACGYLSYLGSESFLDPAIKVCALDTERYYDLAWFYESALPPDTGMSRFLINTVAGRPRTEALQEKDRRSYLAKPFVDEVDFWINLPMVTDQPALGVNGVLANATVWMISNNMRFLNSPANGPAAVAEIAAIPETHERWLFSVVTLESYQYVGGPRFNAVYRVRELEVWLGDNPVGMDYLLWLKINKCRLENRFPLIEPMPIMLKYGAILGVGSLRGSGRDVQEESVPEFESYLSYSSPK